MEQTINNDLRIKKMKMNKGPLPYEVLEAMAKEKLEDEPFGYIYGSASRGETYKKNTAAFANYSILPRFLNNVSTLDLQVELFGKTYPHPLFIAPAGVNKIAHPDGEIAVARAAKNLGYNYMQSTVSSYSIEEIAASAPDSPKWFQLYWQNNKEVAYSLVRRAEKAGYEAIVLTVDTVILGWREEDVRNGYSPLSSGYGQGNYTSDPVFMSSIHTNDQEAIVQGIIENINHPTLNWSDVAEIRKRTSLPILLKGILHPADALQAIEFGLDGIIVSNHGGRQLDGTIASIDALPKIVEVVNGKIPVLFDSGIRRGIDALKALALGATAVCIGRPVLWGLAYNGQQGVEMVLSQILDEFKTSMTLAGVRNIEEARSITIQKD